MTSNSLKPSNIPQTPSGKAKIALHLAGASLLLLLVLVRVIYPGSDAYARLSWSSALLTDEGFYIHNARNLVLFGHARTDEFNNALIMPLLHLLQVLVFRVGGVGAMQARAISIGLSLMTLLVFWDALRRAWGRRCAWVGLALLGLDPTFALYNRLALMDTPACLPLCAAWWLWVIGQEKGEGQQGRRGRGGEREEGETRSQEETGSAGWRSLLSPSLPLPLFLCGMCLGLAYCVRGLTAIVVAVPVVLLAAPVWQQWRHREQETGRQETGTAETNGLSPLLALLAGLILVLLAYAVLWYIPNKTEMAHVNRFYLHEQLLPRSMAQLGRNFWSAISHRHRGVLPFLLKHSPVLLLLNGYWLWMQGTAYSQAARRKKTFGAAISHDAGVDAGQGQTGSSQANKSDLRSGLQEASDLPRTNPERQCAYYLAGWLFVFLVFVSVVDYAPSRYYVMFYPALAGLAAVTLNDALDVRSRRARCLLRQSLIPLALVWVGLNSYWYADWLGHITYRQRDADAWLAAHLPANSVLLGAVAPGLCLNNRFECVVMIENLCNDHAPVERFAPAPRYIVILDTDSDVERSLRRPSQRLWANRWKEKWWVKRYPAIVQHDKRLYAFPHLIRRYFTVGVYAVPADYKPPKRPDRRTKLRFHPPWRDSVSSQYTLPLDALLER